MEIIPNHFGLTPGFEQNTKIGSLCFCACKHKHILRSLVKIKWSWLMTVEKTNRVTPANLLWNFKLSNPFLNDCFIKQLCNHFSGCRKMPVEWMTIICIPEANITFMSSPYPYKHIPMKGPLWMPRHVQMLAKISATGCLKLLIAYIQTCTHILQNAVFSLPPW